MLAADPEVARIILFGSIAQRNPRSPDFDIDLALDEGYPYKAMDLTAESSFRIDLVCLPQLPVSMRRKVESSGIVVGECAGKKSR